MNRVLWILQVLLVVVFLFAGVVKLITPIADMTRQMPIPLPGWFLRFLGLAEIIGAAGLLLPALLRIKPGLTPLAAALLSFITASGTVITLVGGLGAMAILPFVVAALSAFVAYGRWRLAPIPQRS